MKQYRIYTENVNEKELKRIISCYYVGYTVFPTMGMWDDQEEKAVCIEIIADEDRLKIERLSRFIRDAFHQEAVLLTEQEISSTLI